MNYIQTTRRTVLLLLLLPALALAQTQQRYLSGRDKDTSVTWKFFCTAGAQSGYWTNIPVPSNWEMLGFGTLNYHREPTNTVDEAGRYEHEFAAPRDWSDRRVFLVFDGVMTDTHAEINGQSAGPDHEGGFYRFKYEITKLLKFGETNRLSVVVHKRSANESVNRAERQGDYWLFGGIFRPVYLEAVPAAFIERVAIDARADGNFLMEAFADGASAGDTVEAQLLDRDGNPVGEKFEAPLTVTDGQSRATLRTRVAAPLQWTAETPNLYHVNVWLKHDRTSVPQMQQRFGFRTMEVRDGDGLYVNGRRVTLQGADRHSFWPESGRCLSDEIHRLDIGLMKAMNMNAVRMSHYPPDEAFLDRCDELGLYVLDELGGWQSSYDTPTGRRLIGEMLRRDVNHPSILFWDNGNEGGWNRDVDGEFARWDPQQRRVLHPWENFNGVNAAHYRTYPQAKKICESDDIYMPTEFLHGLFDGGAGAGLEDYWSLMRGGKHPGGGFIWALLDEGVRRPDTGEIDVAGNQAPDGILGPHREKEASFYTIQELWSPIVVRRESNGICSVENRYSFTDASRCTFNWQLCKFAPFSLLDTRFDPLPPIPPGRTGIVRLKLPSNWKSYDALTLCVNDPSGRRLWKWAWPLPGADEIRREPLARAKKKAQANETADAIEINAADLTVRISRQTGLLAGIRRGGHSFSLTNGPRLAFGSATLTGIQSRTEGSDGVVTATFTGNLESVTWRVRGNGWVQCDYVYTVATPQECRGVVFDYPEALVKGKKWLGDGPYRVWRNRRRGETFGVWKNDYNNTITGWRDWIYPEFKGCFANVRWLRLDTTEGRVTAVPGNSDGFVQVLVPEFPPEKIRGKTSVSLPPAGLGFLDAIPAAGSKFHQPSDSGPQGRPDTATGKFSGSVAFFFGDLAETADD